MNLKEINKSAAATVFYDGSCPLCSREINHYRRLRGADQLQWIDISSDSSFLKAYQINLQTVMARFHVLDRYGDWQTGAWGFAELWSHLPYYRWLALSLKKLRMLPLLDFFYRHFARWRLARSCSQSACGSRSDQ